MKIQEIGQTIILCIILYCMITTILNILFSFLSFIPLNKKLSTIEPCYKVKFDHWNGGYVICKYKYKREPLIWQSYYCLVPFASLFSTYVLTVKKFTTTNITEEEALSLKVNELKDIYETQLKEHILAKQEHKEIVNKISNLTTCK